MNKALIADLQNIFKSCVSAVKPQSLIKNTLKYNPVTQQLNIAGKKYNLSNKDVYVVGTGKAVQCMANEIEGILLGKIKDGIISIPLGSYNGNVSNIIKYYEGAKDNLPDTYALATASKIKELVGNLTDTDFLIVLISGGGSALLPLPTGIITLEEKTELIKKLANSGATIIELNTVRKRISELKGGQLAILAQPASVVGLILSDIVGNPIDLIASGPTCENQDDIYDAIHIINKYGLYNDMPESIKKVLTVKKNRLRFHKDNVDNIIIGSNKLSIEAGIAIALNLNYLPIEISDIVTGNISDVANEYVKLVNILIQFKNGALNLNQIESLLNSLKITGLKTDFIQNITIDSLKNKNICIILGGEITVEVKGSGKGGRNQQLALEFSKQINEIKHLLQGHDIYFLSAGTDGIDGPTDVAGAIGYLNLIADSKNANINVESFINNNDSYNFYKSFKNGELHIVTGHTNTNVMDIHLIIIKNNV